MHRLARRQAGHSGAGGGAGAAAAAAQPGAAAPPVRRFELCQRWRPRSLPTDLLLPCCFTIVDACSSHRHGAWPAEGVRLCTGAWARCGAGGMRRWQAVVEALEGIGSGGSSAVVDALQTKQGKATVFMADTLLYVDMRRRRLRWSIKLPHLTTVTTHGMQLRPAALPSSCELVSATACLPGTEFS